VTKRRSSKTASPTTSSPGDAAPGETPTVLKREMDSNVQKFTWENTFQEDLMTEFPIKSPCTSVLSPIYISEHPVSAPTQALPPITPLLAAASFEPHQYRESGEPKAREDLQQPLQQNAQYLPPVPSYASRVEDVSILSNGDFSLRHQGESYVCSRYITTRQNPIGKPGNWEI
jgi:hypothetical protein